MRPASPPPRKPRGLTVQRAGSANRRPRQGRDVARCAISPMTHRRIHQGDPPFVRTRRRVRDMGDDRMRRPRDLADRQAWGMQPRQRRWTSPTRPRTVGAVTTPTVNVCAVTRDDVYGGGEPAANGRPGSGRRDQPAADGRWHRLSTASRRWDALRRWPLKPGDRGAVHDGPPSRQADEAHRRGRSQRASRSIRAIPEWYSAVVSPRRADGGRA